MRKQLINREGNIFNTKQGYEVEIMDYSTYSNCTVRFNDDRGTILKNVQYGHIKIGTLTNPNHATFYNKGYVGQGIYKIEQNKVSKTWIGFIERCYSEKYQKIRPTYKDVIVCKEWHNFQNFAEWFYSNYNPETMQGWHLDKDILFKGNKIYTPETCAFVPQEINSLFIKTKHKESNLPTGISKTGNKFKVRLNQKYIGTFNTLEEAFEAYKEVKEKYIKSKADKWKDLISDSVYSAMYNYKVNIDD